MLPPSAMLIVFDGIDGAGKSTQIEATCRWLELRRGAPVRRLRDPGSTPLGMRMRELLLDQHGLPIAPLAEVMLFMTARAQLVAEEIKPALARGEWVVCDRFSFSTVVDQGHAGGVDPEQIWKVNQVATQGITPDLTIILDLPAQIASQRIQRERDRMESRGSDYFQKVREGFLTEARRWPRGVEVIDAHQTAEAIQNTIQQLLMPLVAENRQ
ncbi:MAG: dTMP kinase [Planctomycetota bacterium]